jgi:hypothetical protein
MQDKGLDLTNQFNHCFTWIMKTHENSKQQIKQRLEFFNDTTSDLHTNIMSLVSEILLL